MDEALASSFAGFVSEAGNRLVQEWYDGLAQEDRDELEDRLNYLANLPPSQWRRPEFDKVVSPLHEIRCNAGKSNHTIRIYGAFDKNKRGRFIFLNGSEAKKKSHDTKGQKLALDRLSLLEHGKARTHEFVFKRKPSSKDSQK